MLKITTYGKNDKKIRYLECMNCGVMNTLNRTFSIMCSNCHAPFSRDFELLTISDYYRRKYHKGELS